VGAQIRERARDVFPERPAGPVVGRLRYVIRCAQVTPLKIDESEALWPSPPPTAQSRADFQGRGYGKMPTPARGTHADTDSSPTTDHLSQICSAKHSPMLTRDSAPKPLARPLLEYRTGQIRPSAFRGSRIRSDVHRNSIGRLHQKLDLTPHRPPDRAVDPRRLREVCWENDGSCDRRGPPRTRPTLPAARHSPAAKFSFATRHPPRKHANGYPARLEYCQNFDRLSGWKTCREDRGALELAEQDHVQ
jgi:hypothetical protein